MNRPAALRRRRRGTGGGVKPSRQIMVDELRDERRSLREAQMQLEASRERYADLFDRSPVGYLTLTRSGCVHDVNLTAVSLLGEKQTEIVGRPLFVFICKPDHLKYLRFLGQLRRGSVRESVEVTLSPRKAAPVRVELIGTRVPIEMSSAVPFRVALVDVSDRQRMQQLLREARESLEARVEQRSFELRKVNAQLGKQILERTQLTESLHELNRTLRGLIDSSPLGIIALDRRGRVTMWSKAAERMFGWAEREVLGQPVPYVPHDRERETRAMRMASLDGRSLSVETQRLRKDGSVLDVQITEAPLRNKHGELTSLLVMVLDITNRRRLERQVLEAGEQEQQRLGRDLHDGLGQQLTGIGFMCETLQQRLVQRGQPEAEAAARIVALVKQAILQTHDMAKGLFPLELVGENRMGIALQNLAMTTENLFRIRCRYRGQPLLQIGDHIKALNLYRIAQEAVHNAVRYSHCKGIDIRLAQRDGRAILAVQDDGVGIDPGRVRDGGMGIHSMTYRANMMGGTLDIRRGAHGGTVVTCAVEVSAPRAGAGGRKRGDGR